MHFPEFLTVGITDGFINAFTGGCAFKGTVRGGGAVLATDIELTQVRYVDIGGWPEIHQDMAGSVSVNPLQD